MVASPETKAELIRREFPNIQFDSDPDIERYFELRAAGRSQDALDVYNDRLKTKYPDENNRIRLLKAFRRHDAEFSTLLRRSLLELADSLVERIQRNITVLTSYRQGIDVRNPVKTFRVIEEILKLLPRERYGAMDFLDTYQRYAETLAYKAKEMDEIATLVKTYIVESIAASEDLKTPEQLKAEQDRMRAAQAVDKKAKRLLDLSKIRFSREDVTTIVLSPNIVRKEDKILSYCYKYWLRVGDPVFERTIFLYSRKFRTNHYDIFDCIKRGRTAGSSDEVILNGVSGIIASGYSYSIRGDIYLQVNWRRLKALLYPRKQQAEAESAQEGVKQAKPARRLKKITQEETDARTAGREEQPVTGEQQAALPLAERPAPLPPEPKQISAATTGPKEPAHTAGQITAGNRRAPATVRAVAPRSRDTKPESTGTGERAPASSRTKRVTDGGERGKKPVPPATAASPAAASATRGRPAKTAKPSMQKEGHPPTGRRRAAAASARKPQQRTTISVSQKIKLLSNRSYDVYRDLFLAKIRNTIHAYLQEHQTRPHSLFDTSANDAEDIMYRFFMDNYDNPFMDWEGSEQRKQVEEKGYSVPALDPIIERCYRSL